MRTFDWTETNSDGSDRLSMKTCVLGSFPKIPQGSGANVRSAIQRFERYAIGPKDLYLTYRQVIDRVFHLAQEAELDLTTDGQIRWYDLFDPLCRDIDNLNPAGLLRLFDNNFYYRHPVIIGRLQFQGGTVASWARDAVASSTVPVKVSLPGPLTVFSLAENKSYRNDQQLLEDIVEVLSLEAASLADSGIAEIQWDEPALAYGMKVDEATVKNAYATLLQGSDVTQAVALFWGESLPYLNVFKEVPVQRLYLDAVTDPGVLEALAQESLPYEVGVGLIDARNVRKEDLDWVASVLEPILERQGPDRVWVHPSSGLELLPPDRATEKVLSLRAIKKLINGQKG